MSDPVAQRNLLRTITDVRAGVGRRTSRRRARIPASRSGQFDDLLLAPISDEALRRHLAQTIRCVRQRSLTDFLL